MAYASIARPPEIGMPKKKSSTQAQKMIDVANILREKRDEIYELWMNQQMQSNTLRLDLMSANELEEQSQAFIDAFFDALSSGNVNDIDGEEYTHVRKILIETSQSRAIQGYSPSETATFVFSLKDACTQLLQHEFDDDIDTLRISLTGVSQAIDKLGLQTFESYTQARELIAREQSNTILSMATPVTIIWNHVLLLPIIGTIDSKRAQDIMETMLEKILEEEASVILLDVLGVAAIDSAVAQHLLKICKATELMGCRCVITGITPQIAQSLVHLGLDLGDVVTCANLKMGLTYAFEHLSLEVCAKI